MQNILIPPYIKSLMALLDRNGFEAYIVGGCVRDALMGLTPSDYDMTTNATPEQMKNVFSAYRIIETGIKHGTVTVLSNNKPVEITTYRIDGSYSNHRKPESVTYSSSLCEDLCRRDFTINAMAYNTKDGLVDLYNGQADLDSRIIRCVGEPKKRFTEDALRILRGMRFAATFGFSIDLETEEAMCSCATFLDSISAERKKVELEKFLLAPYFDKVFVRRFDILSIVIPQLNEICDKRMEIATSVSNAPVLTDIRLTLITYFFSLKTAEMVLNNLRFEKATIDTVISLLDCRNILLPKTRSEIKHCMKSVGVVIFRKWLDVNTALYPHLRNDFIKVSSVIDDIISTGEPYNREMLDIDGNALLDYGLKGQSIGIGLNFLLDAVIDGKVKNERDALLAHLATM